MEQQLKAFTGADRLRNLIDENSDLMMVAARSGISLGLKSSCPPVMGSVMSGAGEKAGDPEEDYSAYYGSDEVAYDAGGGDAEEAEEPSAEHSADDAYH